MLSKRIVPRFGELSPEEVADLWQTAQKISGPLQNHFNADALTFAIQDGASAGQSVPHVHVHVVPRAKGDFTKNDEVYDRLEKADMARSFKVDAEKERKVRTMDEMAMEASQLRALFPSSMDIPSDDYPLA